MRKYSILTIVICLSLFLYSTAYAKVTGTCGNCHTMHNSQNNTHMMINETIDGTGGPGGGGYAALTRGTCVGCHTGENIMGGTTPFVYSTNTVTYGEDTLAGGNFKWVVDDDAMGHNVKGIPGLMGDVALSAGAPGDYIGAGCTDSCHETLAAPKDTTGTALATGCQGCHLDPQHHADQQATGGVATEVNGFFRFLSGHMGGDGVHGIEDPNWERDPSVFNHNEYLGENATTGTSNTMTGYCIGCHGKFHEQENNNEWIRHPSDGVLPNEGEYNAYTLYDPNVPIARPDLASIGDSSAVRPGTDMVMCLSCHRAHGSPYKDMLRWQYTSMTAGTGDPIGNEGAGCMKCHSKKN